MISLLTEALQQKIYKENIYIEDDVNNNNNNNNN